MLVHTFAQPEPALTALQCRMSGCLCLCRGLSKADVQAPVRMEDFEQVDEHTYSVFIICIATVNIWCWTTWPVRQQSPD